MSGNGNEFVDGGGDQGQNGGGLRKQLETALARVAELETRNGELETLNASRSKADIFAKLGLPPKLAGLYTGDATEDAIKTWAQEYADVFGSAPAGETPAPEQAPPAGNTPPQVDPATLAQLAAMQQASHAGTSAGNVPSVEAAKQTATNLLAKPGATQADLVAAIAAMGFEGPPDSRSFITG